MTKTERSHWLLSVVLSVVLATHLLWTLQAQPQDVALDAPAQPRLRVRGDFDTITFPNGSTWYLRQGTLNAIWAIPRDQQEEMGGIKTRIYGTGYQINVPQEVTEILDQVYAADIEELEELRERMREE